MSEFLAEASVLIRPDTTKFRATLVAELEAATAGIVVPVTVVAAAGGARSAQQAATATTTLNAAKQEQAAADALAAQEVANLAHAEELAASAAAKLAEVESAGELTTTALAEAKAKLRVATAAVAEAQKAEAAALATNNVELQANVRATLESATAEEAAARAAALEGVAHARTTKEIAGHAAAEHALARGVAFTGASMTGLRGATLAASGAFVVGAVAVTALEKSIHEASGEAEAAASVVRVFGDEIGGNLKKNAEDLATTFGVSTKTALEFEAQLGNTFKQAHIGTQQAADMSEQLVKLAADMAAFKNVPLETALKAITLGLVGNSRGLRQFQVQLNQARVDEEALRETGKKHAKDLTDQERLFARFNLILQETANQQGSVSRRTGELAQQEKTLAANTQNLGAELGRLANPVVTGLVHEINDLFKLVKLTKDAIPGLGGESDKAAHKATLWEKALGTVGGAFKDLVQSGGAFGLIFDFLTQKEDKAKTSTDALSQSVGQVTVVWRRFAAAVAQADLTKANNQLATLQEQLVGIKTAGTDTGPVLANLAKQEAAARRAVTAATRAANAEPLSPARQQRRRDAKTALLNIVEQERQIQQEQADAAQSIVDKINAQVADAIAKLKEAIAASDQAFLDAFAHQDVATNIAGIKAQMTKSLVDDVAIAELERKRILAQMAAARHDIIDAKTLAAFLDQKRVELAQVNLSQKQLEEQQRQNARDRKAARIARAAQSIDLDIELASTNKDIRAEIAARRRKIVFDQERLKSVRGDIIATKQLRNDIAAQRAAIRDLKGEVDKRRKDLEALEFSFLQTQTGFVSNLLSNLVPVSALAGTVGTGAFSTRTPVGGGGGGSPTSASPSGGGGGGVIDFGGAAGGPDRPDAAADVTTAHATSGGPRGVSAAQMSALITIQRHMLQVLSRMAGARSHPEAAVQRAGQAFANDFFNW